MIGTELLNLHSVYCTLSVIIEENVKHILKLNNSVHFLLFFPGSSTPSYCIGMCVFVFVCVCREGGHKLPEGLDRKLTNLGGNTQSFNNNSLNMAAYTHTHMRSHECTSHLTFCWNHFIASSFVTRCFAPILLCLLLRYDTRYPGRLSTI